MAKKDKDQLEELFLRTQCGKKLEICSPITQIAGHFSYFEVANLETGEKYRVRFAIEEMPPVERATQAAKGVSDA